MIASYNSAVTTGESPPHVYVLIGVHEVRLVTAELCHRRVVLHLAAALRDGAARGRVGHAALGAIDTATPHI